MAEELLLSHEDETQTHHSTHQVAQFAVVWITFHGDLGLKRRSTTEGLTEATMHALTQHPSKQLLNDVIFTLFTDKNLFALSTMKNSHNN